VKRWMGTSRRKLFAILLLLIALSAATNLLISGQVELKSLQSDHIYFFAVNLRNNEEILPNFMKEWEEVAMTIGLHRIFISIYENDSTDRTPFLLESFRQRLKRLGVPHLIKSEKNVTNSESGRITRLAEVRNKALRPLFRPEARENSTIWNSGERSVRLVFMNDVYFKAIDILRLIDTQAGEYDVACGMDFYYGFYDSWVTRDVDGGKFDAFFPFVRHSESQKLLRKGQPFLVTSCWNGAAVIDASPIIAGLRFRDNTEGSWGCYHSECFLLCADLRALNRTRIYINPKVKFAYTKRFYLLHNWVFSWVNPIMGLFRSPKPQWTPPESRHNNQVDCGARR